MLENIAIHISQYMHLKKMLRLFGDKSVPKRRENVEKIPIYKHLCHSLVQDDFGFNIEQYQENAM